jgi:hypothetical protein
MDEDALDKAFREERLRKFQEKYPLRPAMQEMVEEQVQQKLAKQFGLPVPPKTADQGVKDMQARIDMLKGDKVETLNAMDDATGYRLEKLTEGLNEIDREIKEAEVRLTEYKAQQGLN